MNTRVGLKCEKSCQEITDSERIDVRPEQRDGTGETPPPATAITIKATAVHIPSYTRCSSTGLIFISVICRIFAAYLYHFATFNGDFFAEFFTEKTLLPRFDVLLVPTFYLNRFLFTNNCFS